MILSDLIDRFRTDANDKAQPYFWEDKEVIAWFNDAIIEAVIRGRLIHESANPSMCRISLSTGQTVCNLHKTMYELDYLAYQATGQTHVSIVCLVSQDYLNHSIPNWRQLEGVPKYAIQGDKGLRVVPKPLSDGVLMVEGYRLPKTPLEVGDDEPEINEAHHQHLIQWVLHKAFSIPDTEGFDPNRASKAESAFTLYFGARPDVDLRRITREDTPQNVKAFWI